MKDFVYDILGNDNQSIEISLDPGGTIVSEPGALIYVEEGIRMEARMDDGSKPDKKILGKLVAAGSRYLSGEAWFMVHYTNESNVVKKIGLAAPYPGTIIPMEMENISGDLIVQRRGFICGQSGVDISFHLAKKQGINFTGTAGMVFQKLSGKGIAFIHAGGNIVEKYLSNEELKIDLGCIAAFESGLEYSLRPLDNIKSMVFGGEGIFLASLKGTGKVWLQTLPINKLIGILKRSGLGER